MKIIYILLFCLSSLVYAEEVSFQGKIEFINGNNILSLSLVNSSRRSICIQDWSYPESENPVTIFSNEFIITNESGNFIKYIGPIVMQSSLLKSHHYFILSPGSELNQKINLSDSYQFLPGKYKLTYFKSFVDCKALSHEQLLLEPSISLKSIYMNHGRDFTILKKKVNSFNSKVWRKYGTILKIDSLEFEI